MKPSGPACVALALLGVVGAADAQNNPTATVVTPAEQSSRDDERLRILRDELKKAEALIESLAKRKAERLAVADTAAADEAEEGRIRALSDVAGIKREIGATRQGSDAAKSAGSVSATSVTPKPVSPSKPQASVPWWDVYGKARRSDPAPSPVSLAQPSGTAEARTLSPRRTE